MWRAEGDEIESPCAARRSLGQERKRVTAKKSLISPYYGDGGRTEGLRRSKGGGKKALSVVRELQRGGKKERKKGQTENIEQGLSQGVGRGRRSD